MAAKTNRNRKLPLNEAWKHYWYVLFPNGDDWRADLETEIQKRLCAPGDAHGFLGEDKTELQPSSWANDLELCIRDNSVIFKFRDKDLCKIPLFMSGNIPVLSNWKEKNPLEKACSSSELTDRACQECREFLIAAVCT